MNFHGFMICGSKQKHKLHQGLLRNEPVFKKKERKKGHDAFCLLVKALIIALANLVALGERTEAKLLFQYKTNEESHK